MLKQRKIVKINHTFNVALAAQNQRNESSRYFGHDQCNEAVGPQNRGHFLVQPRRHPRTVMIEFEVVEVGKSG